MKVSSGQLAGLAANGAAGAPEVQNDAAARTPGAVLSRYDQVELSGLASQIASANAEFAAEQADRVRSVAQLYAGGQYAIDDRQVARSILKYALSSAEPTAGAES
jgi:anti-sigma28 factor (negative regulator of flagellin synthesis)